MTGGKELEVDSAAMKLSRNCATGSHDLVVITMADLAAVEQLATLCHEDQRR